MLKKIKKTYIYIFLSPATKKVNATNSTVIYQTPSSSECDAYSSFFCKLLLNGLIVVRLVVFYLLGVPFSYYLYLNLNFKKTKSYYIFTTYSNLSIYLFIYLSVYLPNQQCMLTFMNIFLNIWIYTLWHPYGNRIVSSCIVREIYMYTRQKARISLEG